jgi:hypothetical protein
MKLYTVLLIITIFFAEPVYSQLPINMSNDELTDKYWNYRKRIQAFIHYGTEPGDGILLNRATYGDAKLQPGENYHTAYYMGVLATEYAIMTNSSQDYSQSLMELYYIMEAYKRLDRNTNSLCPEEYGIEDGCFLRHDFALSGTNYYYNEEIDDNVIIGDLSNIKKQYFNESFGITEEFRLNVFQTSIENIEPMPYGSPTYVNQMVDVNNLGNAELMSQDIVFYLFANLSLIIKLFPDASLPVIDKEGNLIYYNFKYEAQQFMRRTILYMADYGWLWKGNCMEPVLTTTDDGQKGTFSIFFAYPLTVTAYKYGAISKAEIEQHPYLRAVFCNDGMFSQASCNWLNDKVSTILSNESFTHDDYIEMMSLSENAQEATCTDIEEYLAGKPPKNNIYFLLWNALQYYVLTHHTAQMAKSLATITNTWFWEVQDGFPYQRVVINQKVTLPNLKTFHNYHLWNLFYPHLFVVLNEDYNLNDIENSILPINTKLLEILETAPCEGPYNYCLRPSNQFDCPEECIGVVGWRTSNKWFSKNSEQENGKCGEKESDIDNIGQYHGYDFMLAHNLYYLVREEAFQNKMNMNIPFNLPLTAWASEIGSYENPITFHAIDNLSSNKIIYENGDVTFKAGKSIKLESDFHAENGSHFKAEIEDYQICSANRNLIIPYKESTNLYMSNKNKDEMNYDEFYSDLYNLYLEEGLDVYLDTLLNNDNQNIDKNSKENIYQETEYIDLTNNQSFYVYPNPTQNEFTICKMKYTVDDFAEYYVINSLGIIVKEGILNTQKVKINMENASKGIYFVKLIMDGESYIKKIVLK